MSSITLSAPRPRADTPGVLVFPPVIPLAMLLGALALQWLAPLGGLSQIPLPWRAVAGGCLIVPGVAMAALASRRMHRRGTNVLPSRPSLHVVTDGVFARSRNPIYVGNFIVLVGIAVALGLDWIVPLFAPGLLLLHHGIVLREEAYLERKFGAAYRAYRDRTPRYL